MLHEKKREININKVQPVLIIYRGYYYNMFIFKKWFLSICEKIIAFILLKSDCLQFIKKKWLVSSYKKTIALNFFPFLL